MDALEKNNLNDRTRLRSASLFIALDWGGLLAPLATQQANLDALARPGIENFMAISEENWGIKEFQRDRTNELSQSEVSDQRQIADEKVATGRTKLAIQRVVDAYTLAVMTFSAKVKAILMGAKEYAAQVELEQLDVERHRAILAVSKEGLHQKEVKAKIFYEYINRAMVEADIAKAQVDVAKANVRALMADIAAGEADIKVITAQIEQYMAMADKAGLQADVAMIFAEILTKKLSAVKLDVGQKEIAAGFGYIQSRLDDVITHLATEKIEESLKIAYANAAMAALGGILSGEIESENLRGQEASSDLAVLGFAEGATSGEIAQETAMTAGLTAAKVALNSQKSGLRIGLDSRDVWAKALINVAHRYVYKNMMRLSATQRRLTSEETISG